MRYVVYPAMIKAGLARHDLEYYNDAELAAMEIKPWEEKVEPRNDTRHVVL
ncbi:hypothetical protein OAF56_03650 [Pirellulaceae bacterium]|nr:hypothetical protein [Pirellulaceae bacterium]